MRACKRTGRRLVIDLYTAAILEATGNRNIPQVQLARCSVVYSPVKWVQIKQNAWFELLKHHSANRIFIENFGQTSGNKSVLLFRPLYCRDLERGGCLKGASYIYSQWEGYWEKDSYQNLKE